MTVDELAATVAALQRRLAVLELRTGNADDTTFADLPDAEVLAATGGDSKQLARLQATRGALDLPTET